ncbi:MAG: IclR family transcriptional regulator [Rhodobacteraceae bacterium]|nr:IclR family transcriptional regulator [Paracoccaceae bacterium]MBL6640691.1 IclR family transcriptional regulator [Paracoccaceae bacterium]MBL6676864.1 IclR family transcriptional regulator [Paracoccaceae bacterium]MBL6789728.1 IclR family transcriptional regulator [Paracoccaceae bacterium]MBL6858518.1 IclR family transcriptional regulator [Paracoccaceae bacterium]
MHLARVMKVLESVAMAGRPVTASEVQQLTDLPRPTCYRLLHSMQAEQLLDEVSSGRFIVGESLVRLALLGQTDVDICRSAAPTLQRAADDLGEAVFLSRFRNRGVEIIHVEVPGDAKRSFVHPGLGFRPMHACSCSKVIAAFADDTFRQDILSGPMRSFTEYTRCDPQRLSREFDQILSSGYAECVQEIELGVSSVAAPVQIGSVGALYSIGATGPVRRFTKDRRAQIGEQLCQMAQKMGHSLQVAGAAA